MLFTTWNDWSESTGRYQDGIHNWSISQTIACLDVSDWHVFTIRWLPGSTEWAIDGVVVAASSIAQPDLPTYVRLNFWAPASSWTDAYDSKLKPTQRASTNARYFYDVDWVEVRQLN